MRVAPGDAVRVRECDGHGVLPIFIAAGNGSHEDHLAVTNRLNELTELVGSADVVDDDLDRVGTQPADDRAALSRGDLKDPNGRFIIEQQVLYPLIEVKADDAPRR